MSPEDDRESGRGPEPEGWSPAALPLLPTPPEEEERVSVPERSTHWPRPSSYTNLFSSPRSAWIGATKQRRSEGEGRAKKRGGNKKIGGAEGKERERGRRDQATAEPYIRASRACLALPLATPRPLPPGLSSALTNTRVSARRGVPSMAFGGSGRGGQLRGGGARGHRVG